MGKTFTEWLNRQPDCGLCAPPMSSNEFEEFIIKYLLSQPPQIVMPMPDDQCRTEILWDVLIENSKKFRKEWKEYLKRK